MMSFFWSRSYHHVPGGVCFILIRLPVFTCIYLFLINHLRAVCSLLLCLLLFNPLGKLINTYNILCRIRHPVSGHLIRLRYHSLNPKGYVRHMAYSWIHLFLLSNDSCIITGFAQLLIMVRSLSLLQTKTYDLINYVTS